MRILKNLFLALFVTACSPGCSHGGPQTQQAPPTAQGYYQQALQELSRDSVRQSQHLLREAIRVAEREQDSHTLYLAQLQLAQSMAWSNTASALRMAKKALATYERMPDSERNHIILLDYVGTYASQLAFNDDAPFDEALSYARRAYELAVASRDTLGNELVSQTLTSLANICWAMDEHAEALRYAREAAECAPPSLQLGAQQVLARCLFSCDSLAQAEQVYRAMQPGEDLQAAYIVQSNLAKLALRRHDTEEAEAAIDEAFVQAEELYFDALQQKDEYYQASLAEERANERLRYEVILHRRTLWGVLVLGLVLLVTFGFAARAQLRVAASRRIAEAWRRKHEVDERIHDTRLLRQTQYHQQQQLSAQQEMLQQRDAAISFLQDFILQRSEVIRKLGASADRHIVLSPHEWQEVERTLNTIDGNRFALLRALYPGMREEDVQLCILTRLRLTNRAIGNIYAVSISAVQHRKLRLKKDVFGEDAPNTTLEEVLDALTMNSKEQRIKEELTH
ncbi:MAG: hypothetical protein IJT48_13255 [Bacteroidaceae bacterium]|nr:hypothetical protein [Bacteroidaceae bacterium]